MAKAYQVGIHGQMRRRIVAVGNIHINKIVPLHNIRDISNDKHLRALLQTGAIKPDQLEAAIRGYNKTPFEFAWMSDVNDAVLDKADRVFLAQYNRFPTEDTDFRLNGNYHRICRSLQHDWYYYDDQLEKVYSNHEDKPFVRQSDQAEIIEEVQSVKEYKGSIWAFGLVLAGGFVSAPLLGAVIVKAFPGRVAGTAFLVGIVWLAIFIGGLVLTLPRLSERKLKIRTCSKCGKQLSSRYGSKWCPNCRAPFKS